MATSQEAVDALQRHWKQKGVTLVCPMCRQSVFNVTPGAELQVPVSLSVAPDKAPEVYLSQSAYVLYCGNCGFVIPFMRRVVDTSDPPPLPEQPSE